MRKAAPVRVRPARELPKGGAQLKTIRRDVVFCTLIAVLAQAAVQADESPAQPQEQVIVEATRTNLSKLAKEVVLAEQRFYQRYNDLNTVRKYAVNCYNEATTSTHFKRLYCQPVYESEAQAEEAREFLVALGAGSSASAGGADNSPGAAPMKAVASGSMNPAGSAGADTSFVAPAAVPGG